MNQPMPRSLLISASIIRAPGCEIARRESRRNAATLTADNFSISPFSMELEVSRSSGEADRAAVMRGSPEVTRAERFASGGSGG